MRTTLKQEDHEDDDACSVIFLIEKSCENNNLAKGRL
jgi:hypothetical protein